MRNYIASFISTSIKLSFIEMYKLVIREFTEWFN